MEIAKHPAVVNVNGVSYSIVAQVPQYSIQSLQDLQNIPITAPAAAP